MASLRVGGLHWMLRDGRRGVVLEFLAGRLVTHEENGLAGLASGKVTWRCEVISMASTRRF